MDAVSRRPGGRSARVREAVLEAVLDELAEQRDAAALSMERVAARAGVNRTTLYRRWTDRHTLIADAINSRPPDVQQPRDLGAVRDDLIAYFRSLADHFGDDQRSAAVTHAISSSTDPKIQAARRRLIEHRRTNIALIVDRARARGEVTDRLDADLLFEVLFGAGQVHSLVAPEDDVNTYIERLTDFALRGLGVASPRANAPTGAEHEPPGSRSRIVLQDPEG